MPVHARELACVGAGVLAAAVICRIAIALVAALAVLRAGAAAPEKAAPATPHAAASEAVSGEVTGDESTTNIDTGETSVRGHAAWEGRWRGSDFLLTADEIRELQRANTVVAIGNVTLTSSDERVLADRLEYNRLTGHFLAQNVRIGRFPVYIQGVSAEGTLQEITIHKAVISYTEPGRWKPSAKADTIVYSPGRYVRTVSALIGLSGAEFIPISSLRQDLNDAMTANYFTFDAGYRSTLGPILDVGFHVPVMPDFRAGGDLGLYLKRGAMIGPSGTYASPDGSGDMSGFLHSGYIHDYGQRTTDILNQPVPADRGYAEWQHRQQVTDDLTFDANINFWSDSEILRDFRPKEFYPIQEPDNTLEAVYSSQNTFASVFARLQPDKFEPVQARLPELSFDLLPTAIGAGFYERFEASAVSLLEDPPGGGPELASDRLDAFYGLSRPISPTPWFTFTPVAGGRITDYLDTRGASLSGGYFRALGELGFDTQLRTSGTFDFKSPIWGIDGLRHLLTPVISYRYIPDANAGQPYIPEIDRQSFTTYLQPLELGDLRSIDQLEPENTLRLGLENTIQTRQAGYGSTDLLRFNAFDDLNFRPGPGDPDHSDIHAEIAFTPAHWIDFEGAIVFSPASFKLREFDSGLTLRDGDTRTLQLASDFVRHEDDDYLVNFRQKFNEQFSGLILVEYGARLHQFNQRSIGLVQNLSNTWSIKYLFTYNGGPNKEGPIDFQVDVEAIRF
jgi:LPS-assembly protein